MQLTVTTPDTVFPCEVSDDMNISTVKAVCEACSGIPAEEIVLVFNAQSLSDDAKTVQEVGIKDGDMILLQRKRKTSPAAAPAAAGASGLGNLKLPDFSKIAIPGQSTSSGSPRASSSREDDPSVIKAMLESNPEQLGLLRTNNPQLAEAFDSGNMDLFAEVLKKQKEARAEREKMRLRMLTADPFDMEAQRLIAQEIENKNIDANMELAMEYNPESFGTVIMLYIDCVVNGHHIKAFVDSGAQATLMSSAAAERCNIMRLVDKRFAGIAKGVGTQKIIGRVHMAQIQIKDDFLSTSFSILEDQPMDMLLGLDMLKRHQCSIDLKKGVLVIGTTGTVTEFLPEAELPECARLSNKSEANAVAESEKMAEEKEMKEAMERSKRMKPSTSEEKEEESAGGGGDKVLPTDKFTEEDVKTLMAYNFPRAKCVEELRAQNGDVKQATAALFAKSLKF